MMKINRLIPLIILLTFHLYSYADLKVSNNTGETIMLTIGYIENSQHVSAGWFVLKHGETQTVLTSNALKRIYYYYAVDAKKREYLGDEKFSVSSDSQFVIRPNNISSQKSIMIKGFKMVDLLADNLKEYTIQVPGPIAYSRVLAPVMPVPHFEIKAPKGPHQTREVQNQ